MRKILILMTALLMCGAVNVSAQEDAQAKKWEQNLYVSTGLLIDCYSSDYHNESKCDKGVSVRLGYGINHYFNEKFSLMLGTTLRGDLVITTDDNTEDSDNDIFGFLDIPLIAQWHLGTGNSNGNWMVGFGPVVSFCIDNQPYYNYGYWTPNHPLHDKDKLKNTHFSLMPCVAYETKHLRMGIEAQFGVNNANIHYTTYNHDSGTKYLHNICATFGFKF